MAAEQGLLGQPLLLIATLGLLGLLPFAFMTLTSFVKISTVLSIVRGAIGVQNVPSGTVILALSGALTLLAMAPVGSQIGRRLTPLLDQRQDSAAALIATLDAVRDPLRAFLKGNASTKEKNRFYELARAARAPAERGEVAPDDLSVLIPAFVVSELIRAFALGFAIFLPFLVIDLVVANVLLALGMQMTSPTQVSLPFKLLLFVAIDGWGLLAQTLITGYRT